jgi:hypothetical protein
VLQAFGQRGAPPFRRHALATQAYEDTSLPIGHGQTISKPSVVARMLALLFDESAAPVAAGHLGRVLEIGTGCGYQTALLALLSRGVLSIERLRPLHDKARENLAAGARATCAWSTATAGWATRPGRRTTASSPPPAATTCRRPGWNSWPSAAAGGADAGRPRRRPGAAGRRSTGGRLCATAGRSRALRPTKIRQGVNGPSQGSPSPGQAARCRAGQAMNRG